MPSGPRIRANNVYGTISDNPLLIGATSFTSLGLSLLPAVSAQHAVLVFDPKRVFGEPEIVVVTSHLALGTTATITRGQYGTTARQHPQDTAWAHVPVGPDDYTAIVTSGTRPSNPYEGQMIYETDTDYFMGYSGSAWEHGLKIGQWVDYTPTLTQSGTVTFTQDYSRYFKSGRSVTYRFHLTVTGGSPVAGNAVGVSVPFSHVGAGGTNRVLSGVGQVYDTSATTYYSGIASMNTPGSDIIRFYVVPTAGLGSQFLGIASFSAALAVGDVVSGCVTYESTT